MRLMEGTGSSLMFYSMGDADKQSGKQDPFLPQIETLLCQVGGAIHGTSRQSVAGHAMEIGPSPSDWCPRVGVGPVTPFRSGLLRVGCPVSPPSDLQLLKVQDPCLLLTSPRPLDQQKQ